MIGYRVSRTKLRKLIDAESPTWYARAAAGGKPGWSEIKGVFIELQHQKCGYCEKLMPSPLRRPDAPHRTWGGRREYDVEHFRPKGSAKAWPSPGSGLPPYPFATGDAQRRGYPRLSHNPENYLASCKTCNADYKRDYFPIAGNRVSDSSSVPHHDSTEKPLLVNPLSSHTPDPEELIEFEGIVAVPRGKRGLRRKRGRIMIDFFGLNLRDDLDFMRAAMIRLLWVQLELARTGSSKRKRAKADSEAQLLCSPQAPHANCARSFARLYLADRSRAEQYHKEAVALMGGRLGT